MESRGSSRYDRLYLWITEKLIVNIGCTILLCAIVVMFFEASTRSISGTSHWWAEELVRFLVIWAILLCLGPAVSLGHLVRMDLFVRAAPAWAQRYSDIVCALLGILLCGVLVYSGLLHTEHLRRIRMMSESNLDIEIWIIHLALPVGASLLGVQFLRALIVAIRGGKPFPDETL